VFDFTSAACRFLGFVIQVSFVFVAWPRVLMRSLLVL
jgi:hypothetical protein